MIRQTENNFLQFMNKSNSYIEEEYYKLLKFIPVLKERANTNRLLQENIKDLRTLKKNRNIINSEKQKAVSVLSKECKRLQEKLNSI